MRGRPSKSAADLKLHGGYREDRHGDRNEPDMPGVPEKPEDLPEHASWFWDKVVPGLVANGVLREADTAAVIMCCRLWHYCVKAMEACDLDPLDKNAACRMVAFHGAWDRAAAKLGLTPVDRRRVVAEKPKTADTGIISRTRA